MADTRRQRLSIRSSPPLQPPAGVRSCRCICVCCALESFACAGDTSPRRPSSACVSAWEPHTRTHRHTLTRIHAWHGRSTRFQRIRRNTTPADGTFRRVHARWGGAIDHPFLKHFKLFSPSVHGCALTTLSEFATKRATTRRPAMLLYRYDTFFSFFLIGYVGWRGKATPRCGWFLGVLGSDLC